MSFPNGLNNDSKIRSLIRSFSSAFENPIVGLDLLDIPSYEIEIIQGAEEYRYLDTMELRPIEADASIRFYSKSGGDNILLPISYIKDISIIRQSDGGFFRNEELTLKIEFETQNGDMVILIRSNDKKISDFLPKVRSIQKRLYDEMWWSNGEIYFRNEGDEFESIRIFPMIPFLSPGETMVWNNIHTEGVVNKKIRQLDLITNYRIYQYDFEDHMGNYVLMSAVEDVIVSNQRRLSDSNRYGNYVKSSYTITGQGKTKTTSHTVGDISILANGKPLVLFREVSDPNGLARMIKSMNKQCKFTMEQPPQLNKEYVVDISKPEDDSENIIIEPEAPICVFCKKKNLSNAKFCNYCGQALSKSGQCRICNHENPKDAKFCNECGSNLQ